MRVVLWMRMAINIDSSVLVVVNCSHLLPLCCRLGRARPRPPPHSIVLLVYTHYVLDRIRPTNSSIFFVWTQSPSIDINLRCAKRESNVVSFFFKLKNVIFFYGLQIRHMYAYIKCACNISHQ